ncbi:hypothetical protein [Dictyobacter formicarum]|uniref:Uncharacterized protein n=1 Tax=Dictyobacter formicarum TaxID=2778368 RepID=A0ABQ3VQI0_9CHLR|nr:hypothetical protein [Dictyobacter formicarum]GHO87648.1 hypothetical protein KSZ_56540 [Dictyobacter formicarum]
MVFELFKRKKTVLTMQVGEENKRKLNQHQRQLVEALCAVRIDRHEDDRYDCSNIGQRHQCLSNFSLDIVGHALHVNAEEGIYRQVTQILIKLYSMSKKYDGTLLASDVISFYDGVNRLAMSFESFEAPGSWRFSLELLSDSPHVLQRWTEQGYRSDALPLKIVFVTP